MKRWWVVVCAAVLVVLALGPPARAGDEKKEQKKQQKKAAAAAKAAPKPGEAAKKESGKKSVLTEPVVFTMEEATAFGKDDVSGMVHYRYPRGQLATCGTTPNRDVKAYPKLKSKRPLYGSITFDSFTYDPRPGITYHFVLDQSGETANEADGVKTKAAPPGKTGKKAGETKKKSSLLESLSKNLGSEVSPPASTLLMEQQPKCTYDRLYFDLNGDRDLTNDGVITAADKAVFDMPSVRESASTRYFNELAVAFDLGPPVGKRPFVLVPRVRVYGQEDRGYLEFIPKTARKGKVRLNDQECVVWLTQSLTVSGRYDWPYVRLEVVPADRTAKAQPVLRSGALGQVQIIDEQFLIVSASPLGDKLTIAPYRGEFGVLELGAGGRAITEFGLVGELYGRTMTVPLGPPRYVAPENFPRRYKVPVGDYLMPTLTAQYGRLRFSARMTPTIVARSGQTSQVEYPVHIRKDKPCVLEFSGKPEVKFSSPSGTQVFKPGDSIYIGAMLNEPWQKFQIIGLFDTTQQKGTSRYMVDGSLTTIPQYAQLDPTIVIRNASGKEVATGKMPFG